MSLDIKKAVNDFVNKYGIEESGRITGKSTSLVTSWVQSKSIQFDAIQAMVEKDPDMFFGHSVQEAETLAPYAFPAGKRVAILMPSIRPIHIGVLKAVTALYEKDKMQFYTVADNSYVRSRNNCAQWFLDSGCDYAFWLDDDTILPHGDVNYYRTLADNPTFPVNYININPIARLMQTNRTLVGGCYFGRSSTGIAQFKEAYASNIANDAAHSGPRNVVNPTDWVGFGCTLVHKKVFTDIIEKIPNIAVTNAAYAQRFGYKYNFFNHIDDEHSEDTSFCYKAKQAGHQAYVDMAVMPLHMGPIGFTYHNTNKKKTFIPSFQ